MSIETTYELKVLLTHLKHEVERKPVRLGSIYITLFSFESDNIVTFHARTYDKRVYWYDWENEDRQMNFYKEVRDAFGYNTAIFIDGIGIPTVEMHLGRFIQTDFFILSLS